MRDLHVTHAINIPAACLRATFARSGGPGGQNVNKVASKVDLRLDLAAAVPFLSPGHLLRIRQQFANRLDADGRLVIQASEYRDRGRNLEAALARLESLLREALLVPKNRRPTKPTRGSQRRRLADKAHRAKRKQLRTGRDFE